METVLFSLSKFNHERRLGDLSLSSTFKYKLYIVCSHIVQNWILLEDGFILTHENENFDRYIQGMLLGSMWATSFKIQAATVACIFYASV